MRIILVLVMLVLAGCSTGGRSGERAGERSGGRRMTPAPPSAPASTPAPTATTGHEISPPESDAGAHTVTFAIRGSVRRVSVTYALPGAPKRHAVVSPPWTKTFTVGDGQSVDVHAHSSGDGELTCTLKVDGDLVKSATSSGDSATVDCGDSLGF